MTRRKRNLFSSTKQPHGDVREVGAITSAPPKPVRASRWTHGVVAGVVLALCAGLYGWTADFPMVFDDEMYMKNNPLFLSASSFNYPSRFTEFANIPAKLGADPDLSVNFIMRPVSYASLLLNYALDGFHPRWFRVVNIIIHAANAILIYALLQLLLRKSPNAAALPDGTAAFIPAAAALLFAAHPLATESVTYIVQRFTSQSTLFYLLTLCLYFASLSAASRTRAWVLRGSAVVAVVLGMLSKECTFTAPIMAVVIDALVNGTRLRCALKRALPLLLCLPIIPVLVLLTSAAQHSGSFGLVTALNIVNSREDPENHWHYIVTQITVVASYLQRIFWPTGLNLDPEWPTYRSLLAGPVLKSLAVLAGFLGCAWWLMRRRMADVRARFAFAFTLWFFITVSTSSGIVPLPDMMADHRSYLPSIGIFVMVACVLDQLRSHVGHFMSARLVIPVAVVCCVIGLAWATCARNEVWRTHEGLWADTVAKSPGKFRTWGNMGAALALSGKDEEAIKCYQKALQLEPRFQPALFNMSNSLLKLGRPAEALESSLKLVRMHKNTASQPHVVYTVGLGLYGTGRYDEAIGIFKDVLAARPSDAKCHQAIGLSYLRKNMPALALDHFRQAASLMPPSQGLLNDIQIAEAALANSTSKPILNPLFRLQ